jgi:hypothetical protein
VPEPGARFLGSTEVSASADGLHLPDAIGQLARSAHREMSNEKALISSKEPNLSLGSAGR